MKSMRTLATGAVIATALGTIIVHAPTAEAAATVVSDTFTRSVANGWQNAEVGGAWTLRGKSTLFGVNGTSATIQLASPGAGPGADLPQISLTSADATATVTTDKVANGGGTYVSVIGRRLTTGEQYSAQVRLFAGTPTLRIYRRNASGQQFNLTGLVPTSGGTFTSAMPWRVRFSVAGVNPTTLKAKAWPASAEEPRDWTTTVTDATAALQVPGHPGLSAYLSTSSTNTPVKLQVADFVVTSLGVPATPGGLTARAGDGRVALSWSTTNDTQSYNVLRDGTLLTTTDAPSFVDQTVANGRTYSYTVSSTNSIGTSAPSAPVAATPKMSVPAVPSDLTATAGDGAVELAWSAVATADSYLLYRDGALLATVTETTVADTGLPNGVSHRYQVAAANESGPSALSAASSATPMPPLPGAPSALTADPGDGQVRITWSAGAGATGYVVMRDGTVVSTSTATDFIDTRLENGQTYTYSVASSNMAGSSQFTTGVPATPLPALPAVPQGLRATAGAGSIALSWNAVPGAALYEVFRDGALATQTAATSYTDALVTGGADYAYTVSAVNLAGASEPSTAVTVRAVSADTATMPYWGSPVFRDEFDASAVDASKWNVRSRTDLGLLNDASVIDASMVSQSGGLLHVKADWLTTPVVTTTGPSSPNATARWHKTGYLDTRVLKAGNTSFAQRYGRWEVRAKVPTGPNTLGALPAFWLRNSNTGEIDLMESWGYSALPNGLGQYPGSSTTTVFANTSDASAGKKYWRINETLGSGAANTLPSDPVYNGFHTWALEFTPTYFKAYYDGKLYASETPASYPPLWNPSYFGSPLHMRINLHVGPSVKYWGLPDPAHKEWTQPLDYQIDYVRAWAMPAS